jgi:hypothetical protein
MTPCHDVVRRSLAGSVSSAEARNPAGLAEARRLGIQTALHSDDARLQASQPCPEAEVKSSPTIRSL